MAVSYLSQPLQSHAYVPPVDLGLLEKVLSVKQKQFDVNVQKEQAQIDQMGLLDVMKDGDREYLNGKINNLVTNLNTMGGVDYSDQSVAARIEGMGSDIYGDEKVTNAVASTRSVRSLIKSYQDFKTNPKLQKLYSEVNEAYDMRKVQQWMSDGQVGSSYYGASTATPYTPYRDNHIKMFEKLKADLVETITVDGLYVMKEGHKVKTAQDIMAMAADMMTPQERAQMKRDSWYLYNVQSPVAPETLVKKGMEQYYNSVSDAEQVYTHYSEQAKAAVNDPKLRMELMQKATEAKANWDKLKGQEASLLQSNKKAFETDPEEYQYMIYRNDYFRGLGKRFAINETTRSLSFDQAKMFNAKMDQAQAFHNDQMAYLKDKLENDKEMKMLDLYGKVYSRINPKTGQKELIPFDELDLTNTNLQNPDDLNITSSTLTNINNQLLIERDTEDQKYLDKLISKYPNLGIAKPSKSGSGTQRVLYGQEVLEGVNGRRGFQLEDLAGVKDKNIQQRLIKSGLTHEHIQFLNKIYDNYQAILNGKGDTVPDLPEGFADLVEKRRMLDLRIETNRKKMDDVDEAVYGKILTPQERAAYRDYRNHPEKYNGQGTNFWDGVAMTLTGQGDYTQTGNPVLDRALEKVKAANRDFDKEERDYYKTLGSRDVYRTRTFTKGDTKNDNIVNFIKGEISNQHGLPMGGSSKVDFSSLTDVEPISVGVDPTTGGYYIQAILHAGSGDKARQSMYNIPISSENAKKLGLEKSPFEHLDYAVNMMGRAADIPVYATKNLAVAIDVVREDSNDPNNPTAYVQARIYHTDKYGNRTGGYELVPIPQAQGRTASEAFARAKELILRAGRNKQRPITYEEFKKWLFENSKNQSY